MPVLDHEHERHLPADCGQQVRNRAVEPVALGVGITGRWRRQAPHELRQIRQQACQLAALRAESRTHRPGVRSANQLIQSLDERPIRAPHH